MSGIAGIINFDGKPIAPGWIESMTNSMRFRGPDDINHWHSKEPNAAAVALGHCMLRTTPESLQETQPVISDDSSLALVMDGRVDNWLALRRNLLSKQVTLRNHSDAELVLQAFRCWGPGCLDHIEGDFAFAIWNVQNQTLFCARDPLGIKPFHYFWNGSSLVFSSDPHAILALPNVPEVPNEGMIAECLADAWCTRDETFWVGVNSLVAAHCMEVNDTGPKINQYWSPDLFATLDYKNDNEYIEHYRELFTDTVRRLSRSHTPLAIEVSGGLDSSAIFAVAENLRSAGQLLAPNCTGYTLNFAGDPNADEIAYCRAVGAHLGKPIVEVAPAFPPVSQYQDSAKFFRDISQYPNGAMAENELRLAQADGSRVMLDGIGGDEWLNSGRVYYQDELKQVHLRQVLGLLGDDMKHSGAFTSLWWLIRSAGLLSLPNCTINIAKTIRDRINGDHEDGQHWLTSALKEKLLIQQEKQTAQQPNRVRLPSQHNSLATLQDAYIARSHYINDRYAAGFGLEARRPFYTVGMVQFSFMLPTRLQFSQDVDKYTHRCAMKGLLPNMVLERQTKAEFSTTFDHHLRQLRKHFVEEIFDRRDDWITKDQAVPLLETYLSAQQPGLPMWMLWSLLLCDNIFDHRHVQR